MTDRNSYQHGSVVMEVPQAKLMFEEVVPGGWNWSHTLKAGTALRLTDIEGGACVALTLFNPRDTSEKYNMPDTLKAQFTAFLTRGHALYSDMGRVFASLVADTAGRHDTIGGLMSQSMLESRFGIRGYQEARNEYHRSASAALLTEMSKFGLGQRDLTACINVFCRLNVDAQGTLSFAAEQSPAGSFVDLQAEMDCLVVLAPSQHPLDPKKKWSPRPVKVQVWNSGVAAQDNPAWHYGEQNKRGFENTRRYRG